MAPMLDVYLVYLSKFSSSKIDNMTKAYMILAGLGIYEFKAQFSAYYFAPKDLLNW